MSKSCKLEVWFIKEYHMKLHQTKLNEPSPQGHKYSERGYASSTAYNLRNTQKANTTSIINNIAYYQGL